MCTGRAIRKGMSAAVRFFEDEPMAAHMAQTASPQSKNSPCKVFRSFTAPSTASGDFCSSDSSGGYGMGPRYMRPLLRSPTYTTRMLRSQGALTGAGRKLLAAEPPIPLRIRKVASTGHPSLKAGRASFISLAAAEPVPVKEERSTLATLRPERFPNVGAGTFFPSRLVLAAAVDNLPFITAKLFNPQDTAPV